MFCHLAPPPLFVCAGFPLYHCIHNKHNIGIRVELPHLNQPKWWQNSSPPPTFTLYCNNRAKPNLLPPTCSPLFFYQKKMFVKMVFTWFSCWFGSEHNFKFLKKFIEIIQESWRLNISWDSFLHKLWTFTFKIFFNWNPWWCTDKIQEVDFVKMCE